MGSEMCIRDRPLRGGRGKRPAVGHAVSPGEVGGGGHSPSAQLGGDTLALELALVSLFQTSPKFIRVRILPMASTDNSRALTLLPAVDVADGQAVRLVQGAAGTETSYGAPIEAALAWQNAGAEWIHLVDLDAAFGRGSNFELLKEVTGQLDVNVELSGGIRDDESLERALSTGLSLIHI